MPFRSIALPALSLVAGWWLAGSVSADIYRCESQEVPTFQDFPCPGGSEKIELEIRQPSADEVAQLQARQAALRAFIPPAEPKPAPSARAKPVVAPPPPDNAETRRYTKVLTGPAHHHNSDRSRTRRCPLGLTRCDKVGPRVFRRPKANPGLPFPSARASGS